MADEKPLKHKPNQKHTLDEVLKSLQDLIRADLVGEPADTRTDVKPPPSVETRTASRPVPAESKPASASKSVRAEPFDKLRTGPVEARTDTPKQKSAASPFAKHEPPPDHEILPLDESDEDFGSVLDTLDQLITQEIVEPVKYGRHAPEPPELKVVGEDADDEVDLSFEEPEAIEMAGPVNPEDEEIELIALADDEPEPSPAPAEKKTPKKASKPERRADPVDKPTGETPSEKPVLYGRRKDDVPPKKILPSALAQDEFSFDLEGAADALTATALDPDIDKPAPAKTPASVKPEEPPSAAKPAKPIELAATPAAAEPVETESIELAAMPVELEPAEPEATLATPAEPGTVLGEPVEPEDALGHPVEPEETLGKPASPESTLGKPTPRPARQAPRAEPDRRYIKEASGKTGRVDQYQKPARPESAEPRGPVDKTKKTIDKKVDLNKVSFDIAAPATADRKLLDFDEVSHDRPPPELKKGTQPAKSDTPPAWARPPEAKPTEPKQTEKAFRADIATDKVDGSDKNAALAKALESRAPSTPPKKPELPKAPPADAKKSEPPKPKPSEPAKTAVRDTTKTPARAESVEARPAPAAPKKSSLAPGPNKPEPKMPAAPPAMAKRADNDIDDIDLDADPIEPPKTPASDANSIDFKPSAPKPAAKPAAPTMESTPSPKPAVADDIPVLHEVAEPGDVPAAKPLPLPTASQARELAIRVVARLNIERRKAGETPLDIRAIERLQKILTETLARHEAKDKP